MEEDSTKKEVIELISKEAFRIDWTNAIGEQSIFNDQMTSSFFGETNANNFSTFTMGTH